ncbi:MAG: MATE family efflux transporter [Lachnospiraceae bacterium]|nr:MATE family efflux transporter [Lachnospiraceae bacterium]
MAQAVNEEKFINGNLNKLMFSMAIPTIVAQVINILYNIVDRIYIGHIPGASVDALTGVGVALPVIVFISAFSAFVGQGGAPLSSIWLGKGDKEHAEKILGNGTFLLIVFTIILMFVFYVWQKPLLYAFGASDTTIPYASTYLSWYLAGTISVEIALGLNTYIIAQGNSGVAMVSVLAGAIFNIILDPLFIFVFGMGVKGAAIATVISQTLSAIWVLYFLTGKRALLKIKLRYIVPDFGIIKSIFLLGISPFVMRATESLISIVMNSGLQKYGGDIYVAALTVMQSVMQLFSAPIGGFTQGVQPLVSYNYGAQNFTRVRQAYKKMILVCGSFSFITTIVVIVFPQVFAGIFTDDTTLIELVARKMPLFMCGMLLFGVQMAIQPVFLALGQAKISLIIAMLRKVILLTPLAIIFPIYFDADGVFFAEPVSDFISAITAIILFRLNINKILSKEKLEQIK